MQIPLENQKKQIWKHDSKKKKKPKTHIQKQYYKIKNTMLNIQL